MSDNMLEETPIFLKSIKKHICPYEGCNASFPRPWRLESHLKVHIEGKPFKCKYNGCSRSYTNNCHLIRHLKENHLELEKNDSFRCFLCNKLYSNSQNLARHLRTAHHSDFKCDYCEDRFKKKHQLSSHMFIHTGVKSFKCEKCNATFVTISEKTKHQKRHKLHKCVECFQSFQHWSKLLQHKKLIHTPSEFICSHCNRVFTKRDHIVRHIKVHAGPDIKKQFVCLDSNCNKSYASMYNLQHHIRTVHNHVTFDCLHCPAKLASKAKLIKHMKLHNKLKTPKVSVQPKKTQRRKDKGTFKNSTVLKIVGIAESVPQELEPCDTSIPFQL